MPFSTLCRLLLVLCGSQTLFALTFLVWGVYGAVVAQHMLPFDHQIYVTLPNTLMLGSALFLLWPARWVLLNFGYRFTFTAGAIAGVLGHGLIALSLIHESFFLLCGGFLALGFYQAAATFYRMAVPTFFPLHLQSSGISWTIGSALFAALLGPTLVTFTKDYFLFAPFLGTAYALVALGGVGVLLGLWLPTNEKPQNIAAVSFGASFRRFYKDPVFQTACSMNTASSVIMNTLMITTPLAMLGCGLSQGSVSGVMQGHAIAMFLPGLLLGFVAKYLSPLKMLTGAGFLLCGSLAAGLGGESSPFFALALFLLGVSWNLGFSGSSALYALSYTPSDRLAAQAINDMHVLVLAAVSSFVAGWVFAHYSWHGVLWQAVIILIITNLIFLKGCRGVRRNHEHTETQSI